MHVLIIEDDALIALSLRNALGGLGFASFAAATTENEAVAAASWRRPDLITADLGLAAGDGLAAVRRIRGNGGAGVPVVFVTADGHRLRREEPDATLVNKPFDHAALGRGVRAVLPFRT